MKKVIISLFILSILLSYASPVFADSLSNVDAGAYILVDSKTGDILFDHDSDKKIYPASTTKMMTAVIAIEKGNLDQMMKASAAAVNDIGKDGMNIGIMAGEELRLEDLLNALLISSANETANIIAENISPSRKEFVDLMNAKAKELGAVNTHFVNPCGAHDPNHYTTARDLAVIARYAMSLPKFRDIVSKKDYRMPPTNKHSSWPVLATTNKLMYKSSEFFSEVNGIKTGYTGQSGYNLISSAVGNDGTDLISVVIDANPANGKNMVFDYSKNLLEYGFKNNSLQDVSGFNRPVRSAQVKGASGDGKLDLVTSEDLTCFLPLDKNLWNLASVEHISPSLKAPIKQGDIVGYIEYKRDGITIGKVNVIAAKTIDASLITKVSNLFGFIAANPLMRTVSIWVMTILVSFLALKFTLRKLSRALNARRMRN